MPILDISPELITSIATLATKSGEYEYKYAYAYYIAFHHPNPNGEEFNKAITYFREIAHSDYKQKFDACIALGNLALRKLPANIQNISLTEADKFLKMAQKSSSSEKVSKACFNLANLYRQQSTDNFDANDVIALSYYFMASRHLTHTHYQKLIDEALLLAQHNNPNLINNLNKLNYIHFYQVNFEFNNLIEADLFYKIIRCLRDLDYFFHFAYINALESLKCHSEIREHLRAKIDFQLAKTYLTLANQNQMIDYASDSVWYAHQIIQNEGAKLTSKGKKAQKLIETLNPLLNQKSNSGFIEPSKKIISASKNIAGTIMRWVGNIIGSALELLVIWAPKICHYVNDAGLPKQEKDKDLSILNSGIGYIFGAITRYIGYGLGIVIGAAISLCVYPFRTAAEIIDFRLNKEPKLTEQKTQECLSLTDATSEAGFKKEKSEKNHNPNPDGKLFNKSTYGNYRKTLFFQDSHSTKPVHSDGNVPDLIQTPLLFKQSMKCGK